MYTRSATSNFDECARPGCRLLVLPFEPQSRPKAQLAVKTATHDPWILLEFHNSKTRYVGLQSRNSRPEDFEYIHSHEPIVSARRLDHTHAVTRFGRCRGCFFFLESLLLPSCLFIKRRTRGSADEVAFGRMKTFKSREFKR